MIIEIQTYNRQFIFDFLGKNSASIGDTINVPENANLTYNLCMDCKSAEVPEYLKFVLNFGEGFLGGLFANWLYDKLKKSENKIKSLKINKKEVRIDKNEIRRIIEESIKK